MGRNLNALLNSAVKERREQSGERPADADEPPRAESSPVQPSTIGRTAVVAPAISRPGAEGDARTDATGVRSIDGGASPPRARPEAPTEFPAEDRSPLPPTSVPGAVDAGTTPAAESDSAFTTSPRMATPGAATGADADVAAAAAVPPVDAPAATPTAVPAGAPAAAPSVARIVRGEDVDDLPVAPGDPPRPGDRLRMIGVERIRRGVFQPRRFFDQEALQELADSLQAQGMIQPVIVRPFGGAFELIAGERRWRAAQIAGLTEIPAIVREMEDRTVAAVSLIENIQREDLNPLEEAQALTRLCDEFGMTHASVAESIGRSRASVSNLMRLLDLHDEVKVLVDKGELDMGHARALLRVPKVDQPALAIRVAKQGLTVRAVEKLIRTGADKGAGTTSGAAEIDPDVRRLEERLSGVLGAQVSIRQKAGGAGRLEIRYTSLDELEGILEHIR